MLKLRQAISQNQGQSSWQLVQPLGASDFSQDVPLWAAPPVNVATAVRVAVDGFLGEPLAAATTTKGIGVLDAPIGLLSAVWVFLSSTESSSSVKVRLYSAGPPGGAVTGPTDLTDAVNYSDMAEGWNAIPLVVPSERQAVVQGALQESVCTLFPGDVLVLTQGGSGPGVGHAVLLDIA